MRPSALIKRLLTGNSAALTFFPECTCHWRTIGRVTPRRLQNSVILQDGFASTNESWGDCEFSFRARAPRGVEEVQIWGGIWDRGRDSRYIFGLRGGNNDDVYLARYAPDGGIRFLGLAPLGFHPEPGDWYRIGVQARGSRIQIYLNDEKLPRINAMDDAPLWSEGGVSIGGGWLPVEFCDVHVQELPHRALEAFEALDDHVEQPAAIDREKRRREERLLYAPVQIENLIYPRTEISLDGRWLFMPLSGLAGC